jgi:hypothetical protein
MMAATESQLLTRELSNTFRKMASDQQSFLRELVDSLAPTNTNGRRRAPPGASPTANTEANRRLTSSVTNLTKKTLDANRQLGDFARYLRIASRSLRAATVNGGGSGNNNNGNNIETRNLTLAINQLTRHIRRQNGNQPPNGGGGNNNNPRNNQNNQPVGPLDSVLSKLSDALTKFTLTGAAKLAYNDAKLAASTGSKFDILGKDSTYTNSLMMGMTPEEYLKLGAQYRTEAMRSAGGIADWTATLKMSQQDLLPFTGSLADAAKVNAQLQKTVLSYGISFDEAAQVIGTGKNGLVGQLKKLSGITGQTVEQLATTLNGISQSDTTRDMMLKMSTDQRRAFIVDQAKMVTGYTMLTGSIQRAQEIIEKTNQAQSKPAKDRMITAGRQAALIGHLGFSQSEQQRYRQLKSMSSTALNLDPSKQQELIAMEGRIRARLEEEYGKAAKQQQSGNQLNGLQQENYLDNIARIGNFDEIKAANTTADVAMQNSAVTDQLQKNFSAELEGNKLLTDILTGVNRLSTFAGNAGTVGALAAAGLLMRGANKRFGTGRRQHTIDSAQRRADADRLRTYNNLSGNSRTRYRNVHSEALDRASAARAMRTVGIGAGIGIATMAAGAAVDYYIKADSQSHERVKNVASSALDGAGIGAALGSFIPVIGTAVGAALGGVAGAIYGLTRDTKSQLVYDAEHNMAVISTSLLTLNQRRQDEVDRIDARIDAEKKAMDSNIAGDNSEHLLKIQQLETEKKNGEEIFQKQLEAVNKLNDAADEYVKNSSKLMDERKARKKSTTLLNNFDTDEFAKGTGLTSSQLASTFVQSLSSVDSFTTQTGNKISGKELNDLKTKLAEQTASGETISGDVQRLANMAMDIKEKKDAKETNLAAKRQNELSAAAALLPDAETLGIAKTNIQQFDLDLANQRDKALNEYHPGTMGMGGFSGFAPSPSYTPSSAVNIKPPVNPDNKPIDLRSPQVTNSLSGSSATADGTNPTDILALINANTLQMSEVMSKLLEITDKNHKQTMVADAAKTANENVTGVTGASNMSDRRNYGTTGTGRNDRQPVRS